MRYAAVAVLALPMLCAAAPASALEIENFRFGLVCFDGDGTARVCRQTDVVPVTGEGRCVYSGTPRPCTWFGYEFDYRGGAKGAQLHCIQRTSEPVQVGDPRGTGDTGSVQRYSLDLDGGDGHFSNPQYLLYQPKPAGAPALQVEVQCSAGGVEKFRYRYQARFPGAAAD